MNNDNSPKYAAESVREVELERLDELSRRYFRAACAGDSKSAELLLKISERRAKLLGLDAPMQSQLEVITYDSTELIKQYEILKRATTSSSKIPME
jgi:hypothetical protein